MLLNAQKRLKYDQQVHYLHIGPKSECKSFDICYTTNMSWAVTAYNLIADERCLAYLPEGTMQEFRHTLYNQHGLACHDLQFGGL